MKKINYFSFFLLLLFISFSLGCSFFSGGAEPDSFAQRLVIADRQFTAVVETAVELKSADVLNDTQAKKINPWIQKGNKILDKTWNLYNTGKVKKAKKTMKSLHSYGNKIKKVLKGSNKNE